MTHFNRFVLAIFFMIGIIVVQAQDRPDFAISTLPDSIKLAADAIVRINSEHLVVEKPGVAKEKNYRVVTVLNEKAKRELFFRTYTDKFRKVSDVELKLYDADGHYLEKRKRSDLVKFSDDGDQFLSDDMMVMGGFTTPKYPVSIEISYTIEYNGILEYGDFYPVESDTYILSSEYTITTPKVNKPRFKNVMTNIKPSTQESLEYITYTYNVKNVKPYLLESGASNTSVPHVMIAPAAFQMDNTVGDMSTWQQFGQWNLNLLKNSDILPESSVQFYKEITKNAATNREKIAILYNHLQQNYRYVSIQLGIGGWKPFSASFVETNKYGDCKALSNFMRSMLKAIGIESIYTVINAGYDSAPVDPSFPYNGFNHVVLCVPQGKDSIWLECTSRTQPFGLLGNFTENRNAFLITDKGGVLAKTPSSKATDNTITFITDIHLAEDMSSEVNVQLNHTGEFTQYQNQILFLGDESERKNYLIGRMGFKQPTEMNITKGEKRGSVEQTLLALKYSKTQDFNAGVKYFFPARMYKTFNYQLPKMEKRETDYYLEFPFIQSDTTNFHIPNGFTVESMPKANTVVSNFGKLSTNYVFDQSKQLLQTTTQYQFYSHVIHPAEYTEAQKFFAEVSRELQQKVILKKE